ncbi:MAG TPA: hypothetical protein VET88_12530 [Gammaproteobacteria bacterium]|nr:hypothetical protein [Gammaproteobacteria bacterium]
MFDVFTRIQKNTFSLFRKGIESQTHQQNEYWISSRVFHQASSAIIRIIINVPNVDFNTLPAAGMQVVNCLRCIVTGGGVLMANIQLRGTAIT